MWLGYLEQDEQYKNFMNTMKELGIDVIYLHTSGHADYDAFKMLCDIAKPKVAVPIHTEDKYKIKEFTQRLRTEIYSLFRTSTEKSYKRPTRDYEADCRVHNN